MVNGDPALWINIDTDTAERFGFAGSSEAWTAAAHAANRPRS